MRGPSLTAARPGRLRRSAAPVHGPGPHALGARLTHPAPQFTIRGDDDAGPPGVRGPGGQLDDVVVTAAWGRFDSHPRHGLHAARGALDDEYDVHALPLAVPHEVVPQPLGRASAVAPPSVGYGADDVRGIDDEKARCVHVVRVARITPADGTHKAARPSCSAPSTAQLSKDIAGRA